MSAIEALACDREKKLQFIFEFDKVGLNQDLGF